MKKGTRDSWKTAKACHQLPAPADQQYNLQIAVNSSGKLRWHGLEIKTFVRKNDFFAWETFLR